MTTEVTPSGGCRATWTEEGMFPRRAGHDAPAWIVSASLAECPAPEDHPRSPAAANPAQGVTKIRAVFDEAATVLARRWRGGFMGLRRARNTIVPAGLFVFCASVYFISPVHEVTDSHYSMLLSENIWRFGSFELDRYFQDPERHWPRGRMPATSVKMPYQVYSHNGHVYYVYPPGSSILSIPLVAVENAFGLHASDSAAGYSPSRERAIERINASLVTALAVVVLFLVARHVLDVRRAGALALIAAFGTGLFSTASRVMWTHTWGVCLLSGALLLLVGTIRGKAVPPVWLGTLLSWLYFTRPAFSISIAGITLYMLVFHRRAVLPYALTGAVWLACFVAFSLATSGDVLPGYYWHGNAFSPRGFSERFAGVLVSPSRGLLVYSPAVLAVIWLVVRGRRAIAQPGLVVLAAAVTCGHLVTLGLWPTWAGGAAYGARYATDTVPWLVLLAAVGWRAAIDSGSRARLARAAALLLIGASVFVQTPGAVAQASWHWNANRGPDRYWDWSDPQFLHWKLEWPRFLRGR